MKPPEVSPQDLFVRKNRLVVLVHGFNVTQTSADESFADFERALRPEFQARLVRLYWPGDTSTPTDALKGEQGFFTKRLISPLGYPWKPRDALQAAQKLRTLLAKAFQERARAGLSDPLELCFVAHSLGCRLTLELLERIIGSQAPVASGPNGALEVPLTVLMAAAVPRYAVLTAGDFRDTIDQLRRLWILHSRRDSVLSFVFRPGQLFERAYFPDFRLSVRGAVGRRGMPQADRVSVVEGIWDHGDYWRDEEIAKAVETQLSGVRTDLDASAGLRKAIAERRARQRSVAPREVTALPLRPR